MNPSDHHSSSAHQIIALGQFFEGKMVLASKGKYHYPARLIKDNSDGTWIIKWWRLNKHDEAGCYACISQHALVSALWRDLRRRRMIRLGQWTRAHLVEYQQDEIRYPLYLSFSSEVSTALMPHRDILSQLTFSSPNAIFPDVPAFSWALRQKGKVVPFTGLISVEDQARINDWFRSNIPQASSCEHHWVAGIAIGHARTLFVASQHRAEIVSEFDGDFSESDVIKAAWKRLVHFTGKDEEGVPLIDAVDVDLEALKVLEYYIFSLGVDAGEAGNKQWGLDVGMHENDWNPWDVYAPECEVGYQRREAEDPEYGPNYDHEEETQYYETQRLILEREKAARNAKRPKPRPKKVSMCSKFSMSLGSGF
ncbi:hypothetical protein VKT23_020021 [Stygiomarasmius scandens]|uniref:Uncharacterized protein n=1 Tax=Marasmiellus scandens TaxID=2682957 RepID=A0ABR1IN02_9AGAR